MGVNRGGARLERCSRERGREKTRSGEERQTEQRYLRGERVRIEKDRLLQRKTVEWRKRRFQQKDVRKECAGFVPQSDSEEKRTLFA